MAVCCQNLMLGELSSHRALSVLVGTLFKKFDLFLNTPRNSLIATEQTRNKFIHLVVNSYRHNLQFVVRSLFLFIIKFQFVRDVSALFSAIIRLHLKKTLKEEYYCTIDIRYSTVSLAKVP